MIVYSHPACLLHEPGPGHPESPLRLQAVLEAIDALGLPLHEAPLASRAALLRAHTVALVEQLERAAPASGQARIDADTIMSPGSLEAARRAAGAGVAAVDDLLAGRATRVFCAVRPPGHHATRAESMGFCLYNSIAVAALHALASGLQRVSIVDFDVHHGNGTQDICWSEPRLQYLSSHQWPLYPGTGAETERGRSGNVHNAGLPPGSGSAQFREAWREHLLPALDAFAPQLVLVSAGFDGHYLDPLAGLALREPDYAWLSAELVAVAERHAGGRLLSMLEGGYSLTALRASVTAHLQALL